MQPISFQGVYKINLPAYEAKVINDFVYSKENEHKPFRASNRPSVVLFSDIDRDKYSPLEITETGCYILTGKEAKAKEKAFDKFLLASSVLIDTKISKNKQNAIWNKATDKYTKTCKKIFENAKEKYTLNISYDSYNNMPKFTIVG